MSFSKRKIEHCRRLLTDFSKEYRDFIQSHYRLVKESTADGKQIIKLRISKQIPDEWGLKIGDIIHNLRSSLDLLVTDLLIANGNNPNEISGFPVSKSENVYLKEGIKKIDGIGDSAKAVIKKMKPYKDGNPAIWELHQLDIINKHRVIIPVVSENKAVVLDFGEHMRQIFGEDKVGKIPSMPLGIRPAHREVSDGMILFSTNDDSWSKQMEFPKFEFELVFGHGDFMEGVSISQKLNEYLELVETTIAKFDL